MSNLVLDNKVAIITGGGHGLGFEIAKQFASQGARLLICGRKRACHRCLFLKVYQT